jgi:hypothetical protein
MFSIVSCGLITKYDWHFHYVKALIEVKFVLILLGHRCFGQSSAFFVGVKKTKTFAQDLLNSNFYLH